ncbi:hypothetical protein GBA65_22175 (plasmid) [Rubrobacter marinus]|uniref:Uncharacterized protein n=1 Tax=Rubrobacter marinus TaxID=2653852 RepID=A0A6G8Q3W7_9ACTN|nr:hypothetical protein GBA65_22175 [Rubrobacter marinus]
MAGKKIDDPLGFFRERVSFAIERDRLERSTQEYPFNAFEERTVETAKARDVMDAMRYVDAVEDAEAFTAGYALDLAEEHGFSHTEAREAAGENLLYAVDQTLSGRRLQEKAELWRKALRR